MNGITLKRRFEDFSFLSLQWGFRGQTDLKKDKDKKACNQKRVLSHYLSNSFPMHPVSTPWKHNKTLKFSDVFKG